MDCAHGKPTTVACPPCDECADCGGLRSHIPGGQYTPGLACTGWVYLPGATAHLRFDAERDNISWRRADQ